MSTLISLWVATTQFVKATFTPNSPVFFGFDGTRIQMEDEYNTATETNDHTSANFASSIENQGAPSTISAVGSHPSTTPR